MLQNSEFLIPTLITIAIATIIFLVIYFSKKNIILRKLSKFKPKRITQFRTNELTKVSGKVLQVEKPFVAPYSKRKCVAYIFEVKQKVSTGKSSHWKTLVKKEDIQDFFIEKDGELVMVKPSLESSNYYSYMVEDKSVNSGTFNTPTPKFQNVLDDFGIQSETWLGFNKTLKYSERIIEIGETITVGGVAKWKVLNEPIEGYHYSKIAALESNDTQNLIITDLPKAIEVRRRNL
ncbi:hypothetical protein [Thalassobellus suaedae]|uniref:RING-type E3 ubiquitin transferase n=1 Tax=Thalassobellus suaedae TaxID=3074124 RepID=A0ABY9Y7G8_9FLAO|nr:hypothetical protein RHP51_17570 [Flavobacteriaceae bacterium HL-DH14]WNH14218.1 hypothetical protein RHP49_08185 [Flavobacteriaceae bacterium HL-DH10]